jgi:hypothetical protein
LKDRGDLLELLSGTISNLDVCVTCKRAHSRGDSRACNVRVRK